MIQKKWLCLLFFSIFLLQMGYAQQKINYTFGKIEASDFKLAENKIDSGANAIVLADVGSTSFEGDDRGFFTLVFKRFVRVKIINKNGYDIGNYRLFLFHEKDKSTNADVYEKLYAIKGSTYNLENGKIKETKLEEQSIYTEKYNRDYEFKKFSMPALTEGAIYELEYIIKSPFNVRLKAWSFQGEYPCHWSEYKVTIPPPFHYMRSLQGDTSFYINNIKEVFTSYNLKEEGGPYQSQTMLVSGNAVEQRWVKKDVPALHREPYITTLDNYYSRVSFQLNYFQWETGYSKNDRIDYLESWPSTAKTLLQHDDFGHVLNYENNWMNDDLTTLLQGANSNEEKTRRIFAFVRDNFRSLNKEGYNKNTIWTQNTLKEVFNSKRGNVAEINLVLTAMLRHESIHADPLILSTRENGIANAKYPIIEEYNYVVCVAYPDGKRVMLDASQAFNGYGQIPTTCYNGFGHIMNLEDPQAILFNPDSLTEASITSVFINNDEKNRVTGTFKRTLGAAETFGLRDSLSKTERKNYENKILSPLESDLKIENFGIDSLEKFNYPVTIHFDFELKNTMDKTVIYFNPIVGEENKVNPFKSGARYFPVEIPYKMDNMYLLNMEIPTGYQVDEMPKSAKVGFNGQEGLFEYLIQKGENNIQMRVRLKLDKTYFTMEEYASLRDFFAFVEKKESEQIVFRKVK